MTPTQGATTRRRAPSINGVKLDDAHAECGETRRGVACILDKGHVGQHQGTTSWEPKATPLTAAQLRQVIELRRAVHLHRTKAGKWIFISRELPKRRCTPEDCVTVKATP